MNVTQLIAAVNSLGDDQIDDNTIMSWLNDAIAEINKEADCQLPFFTSVSDTPIINETWQRLLLIPFAVGRMKQQDSSKFEYDDHYMKFQDNLSTFVMQYEIPLQYRNLVTGSIFSLPNGSRYKVASYETLGTIATANSTTVQAILDANPNGEVQYQGNGYNSSIYNEPTFPFMGGW